MTRAAAAFLFLPGMLFAQAVAGVGGVSGAVHDASGAAVPGARVIVSNDSKGIRRTLETNEVGRFNAPAFDPSRGYSLAVTKDGFAPWEAHDFEILVGQTLSFKVVLEVAATATRLEIAAAAPLVSETSVGGSQVVEADQIDNLPINGRRADTFVLLTPAVTEDGTFGLVSFRGIAGGNAYLTDGNDTTQSFYGENAGRTRISTQISQDAVQEFQVLSNGYSAEFGRAMGGVINTVTRSGSNRLRGTAYWFFRNRTLNAADRYANGVNLPEWRHQAGASLGGPVRRDKVFYFANFETVQRNFPALNRIINNNLTDGVNITAPCNATAAQCAAAIAFIQRQMNVMVPRTVSSSMGFAKIDWRPAERNSFSFSANAMHWRSPHGIQTQAVLPSGNALGNNAHSTVETRYGKAAWTTIPTNSSVNEFRFGWFKDRLADPDSSDLFPPETGPLSISISGSPASSQIGAASSYPRVRPSEQRFQFLDNLSWTRGLHAAKFGADFATTHDFIDQLDNRFGSYSYSSFTNFARDFSGNTMGVKSYSNFQQAFGEPRQNLRTTDLSLFAQDAWKIHKRLTFNYGLRYERTFLPQPWITNPDYPQTGVIPQSNRNLAPRVSLSFTLDDRTVVRGGYGIFWARFHGNGIDTLLLGNGRFQTSIYVQPSNAGSPVFPHIFSGGGGLPAGTVNLQFASPDFHNPYTQQGNLTVERQLSRNLALSVSYIWSRGIGIWTQRDRNLRAPTQSVTYTIQDAAGNHVGAYTTPVFTAKGDSRYGKILQVENGGQSWYNGLALQLRKRLSHGLSGSVSYTWSHAIDDANMQGASWNIGWNYNNASMPGNYPFDKGSSTLDQRHRAAISFLWSPAFPSGTGALSRFLVNGWQLSSVTTLASARPASATVNVSGTQFPGVYLAYLSMNGSGGWNRVPFWRVNSLDVDQMYRVDARLTRAFPFGERVKAYLNFEAFNAFNTITNTAINTQAFTATGGVLRPTAGLGTGTQSQGFPDGTNARRAQVSLRVIF